MYGPLPQRDGDLKLKIQIDITTFILGYYKEQDLLKPENNGVLTVELVCAAPRHRRPNGFDVDPTTRKKRFYVHPNEESPVTDPFCGECVEACRNYHYPVYVPRNGEWIDVTGELIEDTGPGGYPAKVTHAGMEIHPVTTIKHVSW